jgi:hypothetical protein
MPKRKSRTSDADRLHIFRRIVEGSHDAGERRVEVPTILALAVLRMAERAPRPRGRQPISGRDRVQESMVIILARARKAKLIAAGMPKGKATEQAAEEARKKLAKARNLDVATIMRRMEQRQRR